LTLNFTYSSGSQNSQFDTQPEFDFEDDIPKMDGLGPEEAVGHLKPGSEMTVFYGGSYGWLTGKVLSVSDDAVTGIDRDDWFALYVTNI
jgi:hypothetical protein